MLLLDLPGHFPDRSQSDASQPLLSPSCSEQDRLAF